MHTKYSQLFYTLGDNIDLLPSYTEDCNSCIALINFMSKGGAQVLERNLTLLRHKQLQTHFQKYCFYFFF